MSHHLGKIIWYFSLWLAVAGLAAGQAAAKEAGEADSGKAPAGAVGSRHVNEGKMERLAGQGYHNPCAKSDLVVSQVTIRHGNDGRVWLTPCIAEVCNKATTVNGQVTMTPAGAPAEAVSVAVLPMAAGGSFCYGSAYGVAGAASYRVAVSLPAGREGNTANNSCSVPLPAKGTSRTLRCPH
jgi:hypothetical protein